MGGAHPKKTKKNQSLHQNRQIGIGFFCCFFFWFFLVFFGFLKFPNWHWFFLLFLVFFVFFGFFFGFFWHWFWPEFEIGNWFFLVFFGFFWFFFVFFGLSFGQHSKLETGFWVFCFFFIFLVFFGFFWHLILGLKCHPKKTKKTKKYQKKTKKNQKNPKKNQKKPVATPKLVNRLGFLFGFFFGFFGVSTPQYILHFQFCMKLGLFCKSDERQFSRTNSHDSFEVRGISSFFI